MTKTLCKVVGLLNALWRERRVIFILVGKNPSKVFIIKTKTMPTKKDCRSGCETAVK